VTRLIAPFLPVIRNGNVTWAFSAAGNPGEEFLSPIVEANIDLKIWGGYWDFLKDGKWTLRRKIILDQLAGGVPYNIHFHPELAARWQGGEVYGDDYARALSGAKIGLGFLRKVCPDQHTTRTFEIPACGSMLLADRTPEHQEFFEEGKEADFFDSKEELTEKVRFYTTNERARADLASKGRQRCVDGRYAYVHRMADALAEMGLGC
jgi:spore maturation protein CgeB